MHASINQVRVVQVSVPSPAVVLSTTSDGPSTKPTGANLPLQTVESVIAPTLADEDIRALCEDLHLERVFSSALVRAFVVEAATSLHQKIVLRPLGAKFFSLSLKIWARLETHLCSLFSIVLPLSSSQGVAAPLDGAEASLKRLPSAGQLAPQTLSSASAHSIEDLMALCKDIVSLTSWLGSDYLNFCKASFCDEIVFDIAKSCVAMQQRKVVDLRQALWGHICALLTAVSTIVMIFLVRYSFD